MNSMTFATLQEAWGTTDLATPALDRSDTVGDMVPYRRQKDRGHDPQDTEPEPYKDPYYQRDVLETTEASQRNLAFVVGFIRNVYETKGAAGILALMDSRMANAVRMHALLSFEWLDADALLFGFLCACTLWLLGGVFRGRV